MSRWYRGDLHAHSTVSDGLDAPETVIRRARENGLEFFALTDHRTLDHLRQIPPDSGLILIPGYEHGDRQGHANLYGTGALPLAGAPLDRDGTVAFLRDARRAGAAVSVNHPFHYETTWLPPLDGESYDWVEIWNGPWFNSNQASTVWWQDELEKGRRIPVAGGSDNHGNIPFHYYGQPTTWVLAEEPTPASILSNLKQGHAVLSCSPDGPFITLSCGRSIPGDAAADPREPCRAAVRGLMRGDIVRVITDRGAEREETARDGGDWEASLPLPDRRFVRVEVLRWYPELLARQTAALSNPIYLTA
jgi:hypothetical protein